MKHRIPKLAALAIVAGSLLAPSIASADPDVSITLEGSPFYDAGTGRDGQNISINTTACLAPGTNTPGYTGLFLSMEGDPADSSSIHVFEAQADAQGTFVLDSQVGLGRTGWQYARFYCSTSPITSLSDSALLWVSPVTTMLVEQEAAPAARMTASATTAKSAGTSTAKKTAATSAATKSAGTSSTPGASLRITTDPNALPLVDKVGIVGSKAAALKGKVDTVADTANKLERLLLRLTTRRAVPDKPVTNTDYVEAAFLTTTGRVPNAKTMKPYIERLDRGAIRVAVVEDIALTARDAAWWNAR